MAFNIESARRPADGGFYVSPVRISITEDGELVEPDDVRAAFLLVGEGGSLPIAEAERYGLIGGKEPERKPAPKKAESKPLRGTETKDTEPED